MMSDEARDEINRVEEEEKKNNNNNNNDPDDGPDNGGGGGGGNPNPNRNGRNIIPKNPY
jgi:hypothetical protein